MSNINIRLKEWNKSIFGNIFKEKESVELDLEAFNEYVISHGMTQTKFRIENDLKEKHVQLLAKEEIYWRDKACDTWLKAGDSNTKIFHNSV